jgi:hypothetical protein
MMIMGAFDDYPDLLATGSAISLIAGVSGPPQATARPINVLHRCAFRSPR